MDEKIKFKMHKFELTKNEENFGEIHFVVITDNDTFDIRHKLNVDNDNDLQLLINIENFIRNNITQAKL